MKEKIMILGAGRGQVDLIQTAKRMGYETVVASIKGDYPGFKIADEVCYADISDPEEIAEAAARYKVGGIATACLDTGIAALGYACEKNRLTGLSEAAAKLSGDKLLMKEAFMKNEVQTARHRKVSSVSDISKVIDELRFPLIVKAIDLQGSRGINIAYDKEQLLQGYKRTMNETNKDVCIIEEYIDGYECGAQAFVFHGEVLFVLPCGDITFLGDTKIPIGHYVPLNLDKEVLSKIDYEVRAAIKALELDNCAVNVDLILKDGEVYVIELTGRIGANCLPQLTSIYYGIDIYQMIVQTAMGKNIISYFNGKSNSRGCGYARMLISEQEGILKRIIDNNSKKEETAEITFFIKPGDWINKFSNSKDCIGQVVVKGENLKECEETMARILGHISFELE